ncbi:HEPN domain-containing protein [Oscillatoria sp. CS-180]|uniref:HEPN domain-containing protein n=1 Tax=Oscillatoria sp. CS-180 TaxID=3021720 RepID=UPI00232E96BA|nr:HEPN domain-containing protein [Oscillatoria sp. CS-180]MDB9528644.1 HEPN domain-containing protein [Oscillatoria sp. CS-180]
MQNETVFADEIFGFHVQQAIEKCLKAWIAALDEVYPYTHDLGVLLSFLEQHQCDVAAFWDLLKYNAFAVQLRYQVLLEESFVIERASTLMQVQALYSLVQKVVEGRS